MNGENISNTKDNIVLSPKIRIKSKISKKRRHQVNRSTNANTNNNTNQFSNINEIMIDGSSLEHTQ